LVLKPFPELLDRWQPTVIKGNAAEIGALVGSTDVWVAYADKRAVLKDGRRSPPKVWTALDLDSRTRLLWSSGSHYRSVSHDAAHPPKRFAEAPRPGCIVVLTGKTDYATDGNTVVQLSNGHPLLAEITGSGCMVRMSATPARSFSRFRDAQVGTAVATFCAAASLTAQAEDEHRDGRLYSGDMLAAACAAVLVVTIASELAGEQPDVKGPGTFLPALIDQLSMLTADKIKERAHVAIARNSA
jgi:thiamine-phosphate diphosphorylase/hydroxyethylthiazole kinase